MTQRRPAESIDAVRRHLAATHAQQRRLSVTFRHHSERAELGPYPEVLSALESASSQLETHASQLEGELRTLGGARLEDSVAAAFKAVTSATGSSGAMTGCRWPATQRLKDDIVEVTDLLSSLTVLHTIATARSVESVARTAGRHLGEMTQLLMSLNVLLPSLVVEESSRREPIASVPEALERSRRQVMHAWKYLRPPSIASA